MCISQALKAPDVTVLVRMWHSYVKDLPGKDYAEKAQFLSKFHQLPKGVFLSGPQRCSLEMASCGDEIPGVEGTSSIMSPGSHADTMCTP
jgi:hypothetical protein